jgi:hypothetical protein
MVCLEMARPAASEHFVLQRGDGCCGGRIRGGRVGREEEEEEGGPTATTQPVADSNKLMFGSKKSPSEGP